MKCAFVNSVDAFRGKTRRHLEELFLKLRQEIVVLRRSYNKFEKMKCSCNYLFTALQS